MRRGNLPIESRLITRAGRSLRISAPVAGSKLTNQISPRLTLSGGAVAMEVCFAERLKVGQCCIGRIVVLGEARGSSKYSVALLRRQCTKLSCSPSPLRRLYLACCHNDF